MTQQRVRFVRAPEVVLVSSPRSDECRAAMWYDRREYAAMKAEVRRTLRAVRRGEGGDADAAEDDGVFPARTGGFFTARGLEHLRGSSQNKGRKAYKKNTVNVVLKEQERQRREGIADSEEISRVYRQECSPAIETARDLGVSDESAVLRQLRHEYFVEEELMRVRQQCLTDTKCCIAWLQHNNAKKNDIGPNSCAQIMKTELATKTSLHSVGNRIQPSPVSASPSA
eukprot:CAMPEP_0197435152 /NCGR_PEP_ID=MMETSP1175-20131217/2789_1 /TAXON_ID=1003142 /ORGANISM="Triceratium dubium, Strain CCMP147" /LENGTH=226 /DNA_ID=CAMNT_0042964109 /DNA_START=58 /DNA_END=738 /DNA_ORIENTATION=+